MLDSTERGQIENVSAGEVNDIERIPSIFHPRHGSIPSIRELRLSTELTAKLREFAQQEETTVHGALCAALVLAGRQAIGVAGRFYPRRVSMYDRVESSRFMRLVYIVDITLYRRTLYRRTPPGNDG